MTEKNKKQMSKDDMKDSKGGYFVQWPEAKANGVHIPEEFPVLSKDEQKKEGNGFRTLAP